MVIAKRLAWGDAGPHCYLESRENNMIREKMGAVLGCALLGWALCAATVGISLTRTPLAEALVIHAIAAPILFAFVSIFYFQRFGYTTPLHTAFIFGCVVLFMDYFVAGVLLNQNLGLRASLLGMWIPVVLIFTATHITGLLVTGARRYRAFAR
jgi:hypothetical protein